MGTFLGFMSALVILIIANTVIWPVDHTYQSGYKDSVNSSTFEWHTDLIKHHIAHFDTQTGKFELNK